MVAQVDEVRNWDCDANEMSKRLTAVHQDSVLPYNSNTVQDMISSYAANYSSQHSCEIVQSASDSLQNFSHGVAHQNQESNCQLGQNNTPYYATAVFSTSVMINTPQPSSRSSPNLNNSASTTEKLQTHKEPGYFSRLTHESQQNSAKSSNAFSSSYNGAGFYSTNQQSQEATPFCSSNARLMNPTTHDRVYSLTSLQNQSPLDSAVEINSFTSTNGAPISESSATSQKLFPTFADRMPATSSLLLRQTNNGAHHMSREQLLPCGEPVVGVNQLSTDFHFAKNAKIFPKFPSRFADCGFSKLVNQRSFYRAQTTAYNGVKSNKAKHENFTSHATKTTGNFSDEKLTKMSVRDLNRCLRGCRLGHISAL